MWRLLVLSLVFTLLPTPLEARTPSFKTAVNTQVAAARKQAPALGVHIVEAESGDTVYSFQADTRRVIASNTKLFTTATALDRLGPGFFFETRVVVRGTLEDGVLRGDLAVIGGGDPHLSGRQYNGDSYGPFRPWAQALQDLGVERISGELVLVHGLFDDEIVHEDWPRDQLTRWYEAPVEALSSNDNCVLVKVEPGPAPGRPARVSTVPDLPIFQIRSQASTTGRSRSQNVRIGRLETPGQEHVVTAGGQIYRRTEKVDKWVTVADPVEYFGAALRAAFEEEEVFIEGISRATPQLPAGDWRILHTHRNDLLTILEVINKRSQNFYSESLIKLLGARLCGDGSWDGGIRAVQEFLTEVGIEEGSYSLADGSGMSRNNRFTPRQLTRLLRHMYHHPLAEEFMRTLPYSGELDLSWEKRLATGVYRGNVFAKTGSLNGVSTLSGYAKARSGTLYAFSILLNSAGASWRSKQAQDRILRALIDQG